MIAWYAKEIHILGMDGNNPNSRDVIHGFSGEKQRKIGSIENISSNWDEVIYTYYRQYIMLFDYIYNGLKSNIILKNLGCDISPNMLTGISKVLF